MKTAKLLLLLTSFGCDPALAPDPAPAPPQTPAQAVLDLSHDTGATWQVRYDPDLGTAAFVQGRSAPLGAIDELVSASKSFLVHYRGLFGISDSVDDLSHVATDNDTLGMRHLRFTQVHDKVPIWGTSLVVHLDPQNAVRRVHGHTIAVAPLHIDATATTAPPLSGDAAKELVLQRLQDALPDAMLTAGAALLCYLYDAARAALTLAYRVEVEGQNGALPIHSEIFITAQADGAALQETDLVAQLNLSVPASGSGVGALGDSYKLSLIQRGQTYYLEDAARGIQRTTALRAGERLPGRTVISTAADRWDQVQYGAGEAVDVHAHVATIWDYFASAHGRLGWAGDGHGPVAVAHVGDHLALALFDGRRLLFGDGDGSEYLPLGAALDVVAHEYAHAVIRSQTGLTPSGESAAVDEGLADLFACFIEQAALGDRGNWTIGEAIHPAGALRDLRAEPIGDLEAIRGALRAQQDGGGADPGSARAAAAQFVSHAGYLIAQRTGNARAAALVYRGLTTYLHQFPGFSDLADALLAAAQDLHSADDGVVREVAAVWAGLGVGTVAGAGDPPRP